MPPDKPTIRDLTRAGPSSAAAGQHGHWAAPSLNSQVDLIGPHNEGARLVLECQSQGGYPEPVLSWWRDGRLVDDSYEILSGPEGLVIAKHSAGARLQVGARQGELDNEETDGSDLPSTTIPDQAYDNSPASATTEDGTVVEPNKPIDKQVTQNRLIRNRLELSGLTRADLLANYSCQAWNTKLSEPPTSSVMIDMNRKYLGFFLSFRAT